MTGISFHKDALFKEANKANTDNMKNNSLIFFKFICNLI